MPVVGHGADHLVHATAARDSFDTGNRRQNPQFRDPGAWRLGKNGMLGMNTIAIVLATLLTVVFAGAGGHKLIDSPSKTAAHAGHFGISPGLMRLVGVLEVSAAAGLLAGFVFRPLGVAAAAGVVLLMVGAIVTHRRVKDPVLTWIPAILLGLLAAVFVALGGTG